MFWSGGEVSGSVMASVDRRGNAHGSVAPNLVPAFGDARFQRAPFVGEPVCERSRFPKNEVSDFETMAWRAMAFLLKQLR